jgi:hypothetical protein
VAVIELRTARAFTAATPLEALPFEVLEGKRALLRLPTPPGGGLVQLGPHTLIPIGATCMTDRSSREPLRATCVSCHRAGPTRLMGPLDFGELRMVPEDDPSGAGREVARVKAASPELAALRESMR